MLKLVECPRDAFQGIKEFIPTELKISYMKSLIKSGFYALDMTSFVSQKHVPQMADTEEILQEMIPIKSNAKIMGLCINDKSIDRISQFKLDSWGFPLSLSNTFQKKNSARTIKQIYPILDTVIDSAHRTGAQALVYLSMAFGNPYGDPWSLDILREHLGQAIEYGADVIMLSDTIGCSTPDTIYQVVRASQELLEGTNIELGVHFHSTVAAWYEKIDAAYAMGIRRFDGSIQGRGGCPMTGYGLVGNISTEKMLSYFNSKNIDHSINSLAFEYAYNVALDIFKKYI